MSAKCDKYQKKMCNFADILTEHMYGIDIKGDELLAMGGGIGRAWPTKAHSAMSGRATI